MEKPRFKFMCVSHSGLLERAGTCSLPSFELHSQEFWSMTLHSPLPAASTVNYPSWGGNE